MNKAYMSNLDATIAKQRQARATELSFDIQKMHAIDDNSARLAILVERPFQSRVTEEALAKAINERFTDVRYMPNSVHRMSAADNRLYGIFVERNNRTMSMDTAKEMASASTMTQINDTVYQDENDSIWTVRKEGEHSYLVSQVEDNISDLIGGLQTRALATASAGLHMEEDFGQGMVMAFYNPETASIDFGIAHNGAKVYNVDRDKMQNIEAAHVLMVDDANKFAIEEASTKADLLAYYKMLYGQNPAFFAKIKEIINKAVMV